MNNNKICPKLFLEKLDLLQMLRWTDFLKSGIKFFGQIHFCVAIYTLYKFRVRILVSSFFITLKGNHLNAGIT